MSTHEVLARTIYVGNIQSIPDQQLQEYFQRLATIEAFYHHYSNPADEWLIDYRFIRFAPHTDMNLFLTNKVDHTICRVHLDIRSCEDACRDETRLISDRKICIAHTDSKLNRNVVKKVTEHFYSTIFTSITLSSHQAFTKYGRILNCQCVSSGNGIEYVYIEFESINAVRSALTPGQRHFAGRTSLAVKQPLRPASVTCKLEPMSNQRQKPLANPSSPHQKRTPASVDIAQYSSYSAKRRGDTIDDGLGKSNRSSDSGRSESHLQPCVSVVRTPNVRCPSNDRSSISEVSTDGELVQHCSEEQLKELEAEYDLIIRRDFDEISYQVDRFLRTQVKSYRKLQQLIADELEEGEIKSISPSPSMNSDTRHYRKRTRLSD